MDTLDTMEMISDLAFDMGLFEIENEIERKAAICEEQQWVLAS